MEPQTGQLHEDYYPFFLYIFVNTYIKHNNTVDSQLKGSGFDHQCNEANLT